MTDSHDIVYKIINYKKILIVRERTRDRLPDYEKAERRYSIILYATDFVYGEE